LIEYDSSWPDEFSKERDSIISAIGAFVLRIEHIGSTAIPEIKAKPLIDIAVEVEDESALGKIREPLEKKGYTYFGDRERRGDYFFAKGPESARTHYLHVSTKDSSRFSEVVYFRDRLRADKQLAEFYEELKVSIAIEHAEDRKEYTKKKESFIENVMKGFSNKTDILTSEAAPHA